MSMAPPPYLTSVRNVEAIFSKIKSAGTPPKFNVTFLKSSLGFGSSSDRAIVPQLKYLKLIDDNNTPTERYNLYRGARGSEILGQSIKEAYAEVFLANQNANELEDKELKDLFSSLTGKGDSVTQKMAATFKTLCSIASFSESDQEMTTEDQSPTSSKAEEPNDEAGKVFKGELILRHDVHVHLPATSDVTVYKAIFRAINDELAD